jgi:hypothetical protein
MVACLLVMLAAVPASAKPPANKTYFTILVGADAAYSWQADCLSFTRSEVCTSGGDCGPWELTEPSPDGAFSFELELEAGEDAVMLEGHGRFETRGQKDSIGGTVLVDAEGGTFTFALSGKSTRPRECLQLLEEWQ